MHLASFTQRLPHPAVPSASPLAPQDLLAMVAHELRTPLALLLAAPDAASVRTQVHHIAALLDDVMVLARDGALRCVRRPVDAAALCRAVVAEAEQASGGTHQWDVSIAPDVGVAALDPVLVRQIAGNLLGNAAKYAPVGSTIDVAVRRDDAAVELVVRDHGIGIDPLDQPRIFEPFCRGRNVGERSGTGLGLTIAKRAVDLHGGVIDVASALGQGTQFTVRLPLIAA